MPQKIKAMKSRCIRHYLAMAVGVIIAAGSLAGCDWTCDYKIIFDNKTADTIVVAYLDSAIFSSRINGPLTIAPEGSALVIDDYTFDRNPTKDDVIRSMNIYLPEGFTITSHNGLSRCFLPDSANSQPNSPYVASSFHYESKKWDMGYDLLAHYEITDSILLLTW